MLKKMFTILLTIFINSYLIPQQNSPEEIVKKYDESFLNDNWVKVAELTHPDQLALFRKGLKPNHYEIVASEDKVEIEKLKNLSDLELYTFFIKNLYTNVPAGKNIKAKTILGTIYDKENYAYVIYREEENFPQIIELESSNSEWKLKLDRYINMIFVGPAMMEETYSVDGNMYSSNYDKYNAYKEYDSPVDEKEKIKSMMKTVFEMMTDDEFVNNLATFNKKYYDALIKEGFSREEALQIISETKSPFQK